MEKTYVIRRRFNKKPLFAFKCISSKLCVEVAAPLGADLRRADLSRADLSGADLSGADLSGADLSGADLSGANLDFSVLPLWCGSLTTKTDERLRKQIGYHFASLIKHCGDATDEEKQILETVKNYVNGFHRVGEVEKI